MVNLDTYCTSIHYFNLLDKLPSYIKPLGLGNHTYPKHWLTEQIGENISNLNSYFSEWTKLYWMTNAQLFQGKFLWCFFLSVYNATQSFFYFHNFPFYLHGETKF